MLLYLIYRIHLFSQKRASAGTTSGLFHSPPVASMSLIFTRSIGFSEECFGLHYGHVHKADLGDGDGRKSEHILARQHYFPGWGTCWESLVGKSQVMVSVAMLF